MDTTRIVNTDQFEVKSITGWMDGAKHYKVRSGGCANKLSQTGFHILASGEDAIRI